MAMESRLSSKQLGPHEVTPLWDADDGNLNIVQQTNHPLTPIRAQ
jgi:hypothetical protein